MEIIPLIAAAGVVAFQEVIVNYIRSWIAYGQSGEYDMTGDGASEKNPDWCQIRDPATGKWSLIKIVGYSKPILPGQGGVKFYSVDEKGEEHLHTWPMIDWVNSRINRRKVSKEFENIAFPKNLLELSQK